MGLGADTTRRVLVQFVAEDVNTSSVASGIKGQFAALTAVAATAGAAIKFVGDESLRLDDIAKGFDKSGLNVDTYQKLSHVAKLAGTDIKNVAKATVKLASNMLELERGAGEPVAEALAKINLQMSDLAGKSDSDRLGILADALGGVGSESERAALAVQLMGKSGRDLLPLFAAGSEGIDKALDSVGKIFTREDLAAAEAYVDALTEMQKVADDTAGTLAVAVAPAFTDIANEITSAGKEAGAVLPAISLWLEDVVDGIKPIIKVVGFFARQLGTLGRVADVVGGHLGRASDAAGDMASRAADFVSESRVGDWGREAAEGLGDLTGSTGGLTDSIKEQIPWSDELGRSWDELGRAITGAESAAQEFGGIKQIQQGIRSVLQLGKEVAAQGDARAAKSLETAEGLSFAADETQRQAELMAASGENQLDVNIALREALLLRQESAVLAGDELKTIEATHRIALFDAKLASEAAAKPKGGRGPSRADRARAAGGEAVQDLEHRAELLAISAVSVQEIAAAEDAARTAQLAGLELEREALNVTRARGKVANELLATKKAAIGQEQEIIEAEARADAAEREAEAVEDLRTIEEARAGARAGEASRVIDLETFKLDALGKQLEAQGQLAAAFDVREQQRQREAEFAAAEFAAREEELALRPPEGELEQIERKDALAQLAHDREIARIQQEGAANAALDTELARLAKAEAARRKASITQQKQIAGASRQIIGQGTAFASKALDAAGVDGEQRQRIDMKIAGVSALATGALEFVKGAASIASLNPVQAAAHFAAGAFAVGSGVALIAGNIPSGGAGSSGSAPGPEPSQRETTEAALVPDSVPAADREPSQRVGDPRQTQGSTVINIGEINSLGTVDEDVVENLATELDNLRFKRGAA